MKFLKTLEVKSPTRGTALSAGIDFFVPEKTIEFIEAFSEKNSGVEITEKGFIVKPHGRVNIPSGIKVEFDKNFALIAFNKSGVSLKYGLDVGATVIDADYTGIIHLSLVNTTSNPVEIQFGQKIVQFVLIPVSYAVPVEVKSEEELFTRETERSDKGFGSTGAF